MSLKSRKALHKKLTEMLATGGKFKIRDFPVDAKGFWNETYGGDSMIYIQWETLEMRYAAETILEDAGFKVNREYCQRYANYPAQPKSEIQVSYFKGSRWDE